MYLSHYAFYKMELNTDQIWAPTDVCVRKFHDPHEENRFIREMRKQGYRTYRAPSDVWAMLKAAGAKVLS